MSGHNPKNIFCDYNFGKLHVLKWFTNACEPHIGEEWGMQRHTRGGKSVLRAYSKGASNGTTVTNHPILEPNTSPIMHT